MSLPPNDPRHGTSHAYTKLGCRCTTCRTEATNRARTQRNKRKTRGLPADDPRHGHYSTYHNWGCRCDACYQAQRINNQRRRRRLQPTTHDGLHP